MKKLLPLIILLLIISLQLNAQKAKDILYLKNGSIIYGKLVEVSESQYKIQTSDGSIFVYPAAEVEKFIKESTGVAERKETGLGAGLEGGFLIGAQNSEFVAPFSFNLLAGFNLDKRNIVSLGSGVEFVGVPYTPLFAEYKFIANDKKTAPFIFIRGGGIFYLGGEEGESQDYYYNKKNQKGGISYTLGTGISWAKEDFEPYLSFAYRYFTTSYVQGTYTGTSEYDYTYHEYYHRLEIKFGIRF
jgi:hypothetical protein